MVLSPIETVLARKSIPIVGFVTTVTYNVFILELVLDVAVDNRTLADCLVTQHYHLALPSRFI